MVLVHVEMARCASSVEEACPLVNVPLQLQLQRKSCSRLVHFSVDDKVGLSIIPLSLSAIYTSFNPFGQILASTSSVTDDAAATPPPQLSDQELIMLKSTRRAPGCPPRHQSHERGGCRYALGRARRGPLGFTIVAS
jgi:hypothetical protein